MKKAFSLMEVIIAITILSVVMLTLLQIKSNNIFLVNKSDEKAKINDYLLMAINLENTEKRNENIFLGDKFSFENDDLRRDFKEKKIKIKDEKIDSKTIDNEYMKINITTYRTTYSLENEAKKSIYSFKIEL